MNKIKFIKPIKPSKHLEIEFRKYLTALFKETFYQPLFNSLLIAQNNIYMNSNDAILSSINKGKIIWSNGILKGDFTISTINQFRNLGYKFDKRLEGFRVPKISNLPIDIQAALGRASTNQQAIGNILLEATENLNTALLITDQNIINKAIDIYKNIHFTTTSTVNNNIKKIIPSIDLSKQIKADEIFAEKYTNNLQLPIKGFLDSEIQEVRDYINNQISKGFNRKETEEFFLDRFQVSKTKAKFLARQEVNLATSEAKQIQLRNAGVSQYKWDTTLDGKEREDHKILHGNIFDYSNPPIVNRKTGARANPGQDYGCRCNDIPVVMI